MGERPEQKRRGVLQVGVGWALSVQGRQNPHFGVSSGLGQTGREGREKEKPSETGAGSFHSWAPCSGLSDSGHVKEAPPLGCPLCEH